MMSKSIKVSVLCVVATLIAIVGEQPQPSALFAQAASGQIPRRSAECLRRRRAETLRGCTARRGTARRLPEAEPTASFAGLQAGDCQRDAAVEGRHRFRRCRHAWPRCARRSYFSSRASAGRAARHRFNGERPGESGGCASEPPTHRSIGAWGPLLPDEAGQDRQQEYG